jgi:D-threo-aldose 1-dehydrogenase
VKVDLPRLSLGSAPLGGLFAHVGDDTAIATIHEALAAGVTYVDTAPLYGYGASERRVGAALRQLPAGMSRDSVVVSTKVGRLLDDDAPRGAGDAFVEGSRGSAHFDFSRDGVRRSLDESLERLGLDRVDIALVHDPDNHMEQAINEAVPALVELRDEGVVRAIGAGMNVAAPLERFVRETDIDCILVAGRYTLLDRSAAVSLLPACEEHDVAVVAGGIFNSGILASGTTYDYLPAPPHVVERVDELRAACDEYDVPLAAAALQFVLRHPSITTALMGARTPAEVTDNVALAARPIPDELWAALG